MGVTSKLPPTIHAFVGNIEKISRDWNRVAKVLAFDLQTNFFSSP